MSPVTMLWIASVLVALLFFAAGYLTARRTVQPHDDDRRRVTPPTTVRHHTHGRAGTEAGLEEVLGSVAGLPGMQSAVLADELGLPIAALGEHAEPLAAFAGFVDSVAEKSTMYLPMSKVHRITVEDDMQNTVTAHPRPMGDGSIAIVTLTTGPAPGDEYLDRVLASASRAVGPA